MADPADFVAALQRRDRLAAVAAAQALVKADVPLGNQWRSVAHFARTAGEWTLAFAAMAKFLASAPADPDRLLAQADLLASGGRTEEALATLHRLVATAPNDARVRHFLGTLHIQQGDSEEGKEHLEAALGLWPQSGPTWLAWADASDFAQDDAAYERLLSISSRIGSTPPANRAPFLYALGKAHGDRGDTERAFAAFSEGAALVRPERRYDPVADLEEARASLVSPTDHRPAATADDERAIFVSGLPRSGTTLVEQILATHSDVAGGGELNLTSLAADSMRSLSIDDSRRASEVFAERYHHLLAERFGSGPGRIVDKSLNTSRFLRLVANGLPDAPLVWLRRDPLDAAWSCFRTYFAAGVAWSFDLEHLGTHFAIEDMVFDQWAAALGQRMLTIPYRGLVIEAEQWVPRLLSHCRLTNEPGVMNFHQTRRAVTTSSVSQVRRPLYTSALGSSAPYADHMGPFLAAYERTRKELGLGPP